MEEKLKKEDVSKVDGGWFFVKGKYSNQPYLYKRLGIQIEKHLFKPDVYKKPIFDQGGNFAGMKVISRKEADKLVDVYIFLLSRKEI